MSYYYLFLLILVMISFYMFTSNMDVLGCGDLELSPVIMKVCNDTNYSISFMISAMPIILTILIFIIWRIFSITDIDNIEERSKKLQGRGMEHFLKKSKAVLIDRSKRGNELYEIRLFRTYVLKWLKYEDPSTPGKIYGCYVPSEMTKADQAMAWKFYITEEEYDGLEIEA